ncbi:IQ calmodulin-binding motif protein (macronuclear) [Tetrahymena thermophila SB210]|uniref:IQ calmodulin-binding motif protein n=1 Tax=Tetrahymena thermophila (strain SB210) TaxID=312017 RepID=Q22AX0_TETTS|nr:IQ calmodulin-binding motif protein [Tetrahymena thermophila SB210]EAR82444.2 IQ calmodulin-binding motif protein [Tetrahymena thermophila SB210]|eukprot:XP_001030107.2 IQ calmodulin-binding motif protein [Tetrahymena thermophila SB210]
MNPFFKRNSYQSETSSSGDPINLQPTIFINNNYNQKKELATMIDQQNYINKENSNDANIQAQSQFAGRKISTTQNITVKTSKNKKFPIPLMQKSIKQRIGDQFGQAYIVREDLDFDSPEIYAPNMTIESITDKNKQGKQTRSSTSKHVPTQSTKSKSSQKNSSRQPNTTKSNPNCQIDLFFNHLNEYPQSNQQKLVQNVNSNGYLNGQQQQQAQITKKAQEKNGHEQHSHKRTVSKHNGGNKSTVALSNAGAKKKSKKKTISLKGLNNTQTTSSDMNTISQIPSDSINIFNQFVPPSSVHQQQSHNQQINFNGNQSVTSQRSNNHHALQQLNLLSQNQNKQGQDGTAFYQNQQNNSFCSNQFQQNQINMNQYNNLNNENGQICHTSNTATFEAHGTIDVEDYKINGNRKNNQIFGYQNEDRKQRTSASKKKLNASKRQSSRSKSAGKKSLSKVNASMSQVNTTFTKSKQVDLNKTDTLNVTNKSFSQTNNKKKTQRSPSGGHQNSNLNQISIDNIKKKKIQEIIQKQIELENEKKIQQKKLQLQIDNETIRINNGQRFLKQKAKKDDPKFPWGFNQQKRFSQHRSEKSQERINNLNNTQKYDETKRRELFGLSFLNKIDENTLQSIKKKNQEQKEHKEQQFEHHHSNRAQKTLEEHQNILAFMEYQKKRQIEKSKELEQEKKEIQKMKVENLKKLNDTIKRQQRSSRSKSVQKKSFIMNINDNQQSQNSYYQIRQGRSTSEDAYALQRVPSDFIRQQQVLHNKLFLQQNTIINQQQSDIKIDIEALENEQNSDRKFSLLNNECKSILHQAKLEQNLKQQNLNLSIVSNKGDNTNQTLHQNYMQVGSHPGKMSSGQTSLHSFITKNSKETSNQKVLQESNRNQIIHQKFEQYLNIQKRLQLLQDQMLQKQQQQQQLQNQVIIQNQGGNQQQQQQQQLALQSVDQYLYEIQNQLQNQENNYHENTQNMYYIQHPEESQNNNFQSSNENQHIPSESDVDPRLVLESSSSSIDSDYSQRKNIKYQQQQQNNIQQNGAPIQNPSKQNYSNRYSNQDSQINYENHSSNRLNEEVNQGEYEIDNQQIHIISPLEFNRGPSDVLSSQNESSRNQQWNQNLVSKDQNIQFNGEFEQDMENSQSKQISSVSNQKNQRSDFMYNQSSQSFHDIKDSSRQQIGNSGKIDDSSKSNKIQKKQYEYEDPDYDNDDEELQQIKQIRDIEQQALLNSTNANLNKTNNVSIISNQPLILNNNISKEQMQQAAMLIQKVWKGYYTRIILGYRLQQIQQEENDESFDLTEEQEDELLKMQILQYLQESNEQWTQEEFEEYFLKFKQKNAIEKEKRRQKKQLQKQAQMQQQAQHYQQSASAKKSVVNESQNERSVKQEYENKLHDSSENKHIVHSSSSYDLQHMDSRKKQENSSQENEIEKIISNQHHLHLNSLADQKVSTSNKQTDEILNTDDLLMDEEQYIKSAQRYQYIKENQPHLIDNQVEINYDELMKLGQNPSKFSPGDHQKIQQQKMNIPFHPIDPRYQAQQKEMQKVQEQNTYEMESSEGHQQYDYEDDQEYENEEIDDQQILNFLKQGINLNHLGGKETFDIQNKKLIIQDGDGLYELDLSQLPGINNLHFKEDQYAQSNRDQQKSGQKYSDIEDLDSYSQRNKLNTKEVGQGEEEYVNFGNEEDEDDDDRELAEINNNIKQIESTNKEKEFNKLQNISKNRKVNLGIEIDDDPTYNDSAQINFLNNNIQNQAASKKREQQQLPNQANNQKSVNGQLYENQQADQSQQQSSAKSKYEGEKSQDHTGEKIKQYNHYMENLEFSEKKAASAHQQSQSNDYNNSHNQEGEGEEEFEEYEIDFEQLLMKDKYQDEEGNIFIIENGDKIYLGEEEIEALNEYAAQFMQSKRVKEDNSFEKDNDEEEVDEQVDYDGQHHLEDQYDDEQLDQEEEDEDIYDNHIQNQMNNYHNRDQYDDEDDNHTPDEAYNEETLTDQQCLQQEQPEANFNKIGSSSSQNNKEKQEQQNIQQQANQKQINNQDNQIQTTFNNQKNQNTNIHQNDDVTDIDFIAKQQQQQKSFQNFENNSIQTHENINKNQTSQQRDELLKEFSVSQHSENQIFNNSNQNQSINSQDNFQNGNNLNKTNQNNLNISNQNNFNLNNQNFNNLIQINPNSNSQNSNSRNQNLNNSNQNFNSPQKSQTQNFNNEILNSDFKQNDLSQISYNEFKQLQSDLKTKQEQIKQWADIVSMLQEYDQNNPQSLIEQIKLKSQQNFQQLANELKNQEGLSQQILESPQPLLKEQEKSPITNDDNSKSQRSAKKKLVIDVDKIEDEFLQKVRQQTFSAQDMHQLKKDQKTKSQSQLVQSQDQVIEYDSQSSEDITSASKLKRKFIQQRGSNIDSLIPSFQFSSKTLKSMATPGKINTDSEENEDGSSATGSLFEEAPFLVFYQKYREVMKTDSINQILKFREQALIKRHNIEEKNLKKNLEINRISPRTYDIKRLELEKMVTKEREQIHKTRQDIERTWNQTAQTIARTQRDLMFLKKVKANQEMNPTHTHNPHQMLLLNMNTPPPLFTEGNEILSSRNPMYSSQSSSAFKQRRVLFKSESETETEGSWKHYNRNMRYNLNDIKTPDNNYSQNIVVIDSYEPIDISKKNNNKQQDKSINFSKTLGSTITGSLDENNSQIVNTNRSHAKVEQNSSARQRSSSLTSERLKTDQSQRKYSSENSEGDAHQNKKKADLLNQDKDLDQYEDDFDVDINEDIDQSSDSKILQKKLKEMNIQNQFEADFQDLQKEREEFEENYKDLDTTEKKNIYEKTDFSLDDQQVSQEIFDEKNIYTSSRKLYDVLIHKQPEEYFNQLLQQTPANNVQDSADSKQFSQESIQDRAQKLVNHTDSDGTDQSKEFNSISSSQKEANIIQKKLFNKNDQFEQVTASYDAPEVDFENLSENRSLDMNSSVFQKTPAQITKNNKNGIKGIGQRNYRESHENGEFSSENMFCSASSNLQGVIQEKNATVLSSLDWEGQLSARQSAEENDLKHSGNKILQNQAAGRNPSTFEKKSNNNAPQGNNNILMAEELDTNIEQYHLQNTSYQNQVQNLCANYHNNYSLTESINTCYGQLSTNSAIAQQIQQSNQIHSSYKQIFPKSSNKSSAEKFSDFNYSSSKECTLNFVDDQDTAQKQKRDLQTQNTQQQQQNQQGFIYDIQDDDYEIDLEYEASANKQKSIAPLQKSDNKGKILNTKQVPLQTPIEEEELTQGKDVNIQNLSCKYDSEVFVEESVDDQEKDILQFSNLINPNAIQNMQPLNTVEDSITEESEIAEQVHIKQSTSLPNREINDDELPSSYVTKDQFVDSQENQEDYDYEESALSVNAFNTELQLKELQQKTVKNQNVDFLCDDLINSLMDEATEEFSKNEEIKRKLKNCSEYFETLQQAQKYQSYQDQENEDEEAIIQEELSIAQKEYGQPSYSLKQRLRGIQTQVSAIREYLSKLSEYIIENYLDTFVERINYSLGPTAIEMLRFLHFTDQNNSLDSQLDNSSDFSMQHSAVLITDLYSTFEMLLLEEKKQKKQQQKLEREQNEQSENYVCDDTDEEDIVLSEQHKVSLKDITHIHNKVIFDAFNEALDNHRLYGLKGRPFPWKVDATKINNAPITHDKVPSILRKSVTKVIEWAECQCGFIFDRPDAQLPTNQTLNEEYISKIKEKRLTDMLHSEVKEAEEKWIIYDDEYTEIQVEISELVFQELLFEFEGELSKINNKKLGLDQNINNENNN